MMLSWIPVEDLLAIYGGLVTAYHDGGGYRLEAARLGDGDSRVGFCETEDRAAWFRACFVHALLDQFQRNYPAALITVNGRETGNWLRLARFTDKYWTITVESKRAQFGIVERHLGGSAGTGPVA